MTALVWDAEAVRARLASVDVLAAMRELFASLASGEAVQPPQTVTLFPGERGDVITYGGVLGGEGVFGTKVSPYLVTGGRPIITAYTLLMSMATGEPLLLCDSAELTVHRTAATTALAVDLLAAPGASRLAVVGSGPVALAHVRYALPLRSWDAVSIWSLDTTGLAGRLPEGVHVASTLAEATADADVVMLCTSSGAPVLDPASLTKPALITSISTNAPRAHEVPPASVPTMDVYCDYAATTPDAAGELVLARELGWSPDAILGDLPALVAGRPPAPWSGRHRFFRSIGLGLEDVKLALAIYSAPSALGGA